VKRAQAPGAPGGASTIRAALALALASIHYRTSVAGEARRALEGWQRRAQAIGEQRLREIALSKLADERLNAEGAGMLAVLAPRAQRSTAVRATIALQVLYDYLDGVSESAAGAQEGEQGGLYEPFIYAFTADGARRRDEHESAADGYAEELADTVTEALTSLPGAQRVAGVLAAGAKRCAQAQLHAHAIPHAGVEQARAWALERSEGALAWQETLAGAAASVVSLHAVLGAASDGRTTTRQAEALDRLYLSISAVTTLLDSIVDRESDESAREAGFTSLYESEGALAEGLARAARQALADTTKIPHGAFHLSMLAGIIGYYATAQGAQSEYARPLIAQARAQLGPLVGLTLPVWRKLRTSHN
jgi:tetraprenyl-beta-curcumene synthase